jgi:hypothetical protein
MTFRFNRVTALILYVLLLPLVLVIRLWQFLIGHRKPEYASTIEGDPLAYAGERPILIAIWDESASVWTAATAEVVEQLKTEFAGQCEFAYVEESPESVAKYGWAVVPTLVLRHRGKEVGRFSNTIEADEVRPAIDATLAEPSAAPDRAGR